MPESVILSEEDINRILTRIAHEIVESGDVDKLVLIGVRTRGFPIANRIASIISGFMNAEIPTGVLDFTLYRDDLDSLPGQLTIDPSDIPGKIVGKRVILVDDVLFTGRSARAAIDALIDWGRPASIQLAVIIDRGHREMPIKADFVGKNIPSSLTERVQVHVREVDGIDQVVLLKNSAMMTGGGSHL